MLVATIFPEIVFYVAFMQNVGALTSVKIKEDRHHYLDVATCLLRRCDGSMLRYLVAHYCLPTLGKFAIQ